MINQNQWRPEPGPHKGADALNASSRAAVRLPSSAQLAAAARLVPETPGLTAEETARRFLAGAKRAGIDTSLMFGILKGTAGSDQDSAGPPEIPEVEHVAMLVPGSGRAAVVFVSGPDKDDGPESTQHRIACLDAARVCADREHDLCVLQSLPEPHESHMIDALDGAGFVHVGDLAYLKRPLRGSDPAVASDQKQSWPDGVEVRRVSSIADGSRDRELLIRALDRSYLETLDCPKLCGMRRTEDVLDSHAATGAMDPNLWWLVFREGQPEGCVLLSEVPGSGTVELVYLGLGPALRGLGLGRSLLAYAIKAIGSHRSASGASSLVCAVDRENKPALRVYESFGFVEFSSRCAYVLPLDSGTGSHTS